MDRTKYWKTANGRKLEIKKMDTKHLFHVVRMIWNHSAPEELRLYPYRQYVFLGYRKGSLTTSLRSIIGELKNRSDLTPEQLDQMRFMAENAPKAREMELLGAPPKPEEYDYDDHELMYGQF